MQDKSSRLFKNYFYFIVVILILSLAICGCKKDNIFGVKEIIFPDKSVSLQPVSGSDGTEYLIAPLKAESSELGLNVILSGNKWKIKVDGIQVLNNSPFVLGNLDYGLNSRDLEVYNADSMNHIYKMNLYRALPVPGPDSYNGSRDVPGGRFRINDNNTITDLNTGLIWLQNPSEAGRMNWYEAFEYVNKLKENGANGRNDWRLPNINELRSLINHNAAQASDWLDSAGFVNIQGIYWSSTTYAVDTEFAWNVWFVHSHAPNCPRKTSNVFVWPVCGAGITPKTGAHELAGYQFREFEDGNLPQGISWPEPRFRDNRDGTLKDNMTGLMWIGNADISGLNNYDDTLLFLENLNSANNKNNGGYHDWRIPSLEEMQTLVHFGIADISEWLESIEPGFENVQNFYWTKTVFTKAEERKSYWFISMKNGITAEFGEMSLLSCLPVRSSD